MGEGEMIVRLGMDQQSGLIQRSIQMCGSSKRPPNIERQVDLNSADHDHGVPEIYRFNDSGGVRAANALDCCAFSELG